MHRPHQDSSAFSRGLVTKCPLGTQRNIRLPFVEHVLFSPDGGRLAYLVGHAGESLFAGKTFQARRQAVVDRQEETAYDCVDIAPQFSPDGSHFLYVVHKRNMDQRSMVVIDGQEGKQYDDVFAWRVEKALGDSPEFPAADRQARIPAEP